MKNIIRIFSCLSILSAWFLSGLGLEAKASTIFPIANIIKQTKLAEVTQNNAFTLYSGNEINMTEDNNKIYAHYSHSSHYSHYSHSSHHSHYSSRY